jgi:hypothetical protein
MDIYQNILQYLRQRLLKITNLLLPNTAGSEPLNLTSAMCPDFKSNLTAVRCSLLGKSSRKMAKWLDKQTVKSYNFFVEKHYL